MHRTADELIRVTPLEAISSTATRKTTEPASAANGSNDRFWDRHDVVREFCLVADNANCISPESHSTLAVIFICCSTGSLRIVSLR
ncbi:hypothetical protein NS334_16275 [Sphingomonas endophytica]|uniref:Uncharacterized protein n=1 Tax=Sphingomonas endophytica TaxID=869719 RepID=A0A147HTR8_9SPHN|nr:hypothetical protein NS334_16275 [Sphingomonas endophytica]